jgi:hypothetical protein
MLPKSQGLDLSNLDHTSKEEIEAHLLTRWEGRGPLYDLYASSLMLDYHPDFAKLHWLGADNFGLPGGTSRCAGPLRGSPAPRGHRGAGRAMGLCQKNLYSPTTSKSIRPYQAFFLDGSIQ